MKRRDFLKLLIGGGSYILFSSCGAGGSSQASQAVEYKSIKFGLGDDPEKMIDGYDKSAKMVLDALKPDIVCMWINGGRDTSGNLYTPSMSYIEEWASKQRFNEWSKDGYELMVITWENYNGQNPALGTPTYGDWHISDIFLETLDRLAGYLKSQFSGKLYFALAAEQSTYTACRYDKTCSNQSLYSDTIDSVTEEYFSKLRDKLIQAIKLLKGYFPDADIGTCFGGWLVEFEKGVEFIKYFDPVIQESTANFFQSMLGVTASENNGYGNPERILKNAEFYINYKKPVHLAYYMPINQRADVIANDMIRMSSDSYLETIAQYLSSFSFMYYGVLKENEYDCLSLTEDFRKKLKDIEISI